MACWMGGNPPPVNDLSQSEGLSLPQPVRAFTTTEAVHARDGFHFFAPASSSHSYKVNGLIQGT